MAVERTQMQSGSESRHDRLPPVPIVVAAIVAAEAIWLIVLFVVFARVLL